MPRETPRCRDAEWIRVKSGQEEPFLTTRISQPLGVLAPRRLPHRLRSPPESLERPAVRRFPYLFKGPLSYLTDALARDSHQRPDLRERHRVAAFLYLVVEVQVLGLARRELFLEDALDERTHQLA